MVIRHGKLCWEGGYPGGSTEKYQVYSVTKTFGAMLFGMVASRSRLSDEDPVTDWIPPEDLGAINPKAKLAHVLAMVSTNADLRPGKKGAWSYDTFGDREINRLVGVMDRAIAGEPERFPGVEERRRARAEGAVRAARDEVVELGRAARSPATSTRTSATWRRLGQLVLQRGRWRAASSSTRSTCTG